VPRQIRPPWEIIRPPLEIPAAAEKPKPAEKPAPWQKPAAAEKPKAAAAAAEKAAFSAHPQFELLSKVVPGLSPRGFSIVEGTVKRFARNFETGARNPDRFLSEVSLSQPELVKEWQKTPREKRIFVIGSGKDSAKISEFAESLKPDGYTVFFYKFCRPLCPSKGVGAMAGTSGQTMLYQTPSAKLSKYVKVEVATARFLEGLDKQAVVLIDSSALLAAKSTKFAMYVANMPKPTPSPGQIGTEVE
jgi:hypothetical protein